MITISLLELNGDLLEHYFTNNTNLPSNLKYIKYAYDTYSFTFISDNGVFSKNKIDYGSRLLVETFLKNNQSKISNLLDVGCGYGFMGITLSKILNCEATLVDVNKRAVHLAERNIKENQVQGNSLVSDGYQFVQKKYDLIITNPPIRAGKEVVLRILKGAQEFLNPNGTLWFVIRKDQGAKSIMKTLEEIYEIRVLEKEKGFYIFTAKNR